MAKRRQYGEETVVMRVPKSLVPKVKAMMDDMKVIESTAVELTPAAERLAKVMAYGYNRTMLSLVNHLEKKAIEEGDDEFALHLQVMREEFESPTLTSEMTHMLLQGLEDCSRK
jgi:hypothetical protein